MSIKKQRHRQTKSPVLLRTPECDRFETARVKAKEQLAQLYDKALEEVGKDNAEIFEIHQMMLDDEDYLDAIKKHD